jgi:hypothetical protein
MRRHRGEPNEDEPSSRWVPSPNGGGVEPTMIDAALSSTVDGNPKPVSDGESWVRTVVSPESEKWGTLRPSRNVLVVVRTLTTLTWLFDILPELLEDQRVQVVFTVNGESSAYERGVGEFVREIGGCLLPWEQATAQRFDIAISASHYGGLDELCSPLLILPHGPGFSKTISLPLPGNPFDAESVCGEVTVALTHEEQRGQWRESIDHGVRPVIVGDPCLDRLRASLIDRDRYRAAPGVSQDQKLVVVSSTWGPHALLAHRPDLPARLLGVLPEDEYVVALILHPNIWVGHGSWQVRLWLRRALESGLRLMPVREGWRAAVVAADGLICDHGSVCLYSAALGVPLMTGAFGDEELDQTTPLAELGRRVPRLESDSALRQRIEALVSAARDETRYQELLARVFSNEGRALERLQATIYATMKLEPPQTRPRVLPVPIPRPEGQLPRTHLVVVERRSAADDGCPILAVERFPACLEPLEAQRRAGRFLVANEGEPQRGLRESAAVVTRSDREERMAPRADVVRWAASVLAQYPGCRIAAATDGQRHWLSFRDGPLLRAQVNPAVDLVVTAAAAYALFVEDALNLAMKPTFVVVIGTRAVGIHLTRLSPPQAGD